MLSVLCVGPENANRSQMAEGFARHHGGGRIHPASAGSAPAALVNPRAVAAMARRGIDLGDPRPKGFADLPQESTWDILVTMGCGDRCPHLPARRRVDWELPDPRDLEPSEYDRIRDEIEARVLQLIAELASG